MHRLLTRLLAQIIKLWANFPDYPIKTIRLNNAAEFTSQAFDNYCMSVEINVEHPVAHTHTQNGMAESFIKRLQLIGRHLLMRTKLPVSAWGHAMLQAASLVRIRPTAYHKYSSLQLVFGQQPNISHIRVFGCAVYVLIAPPQCTKMGPQRRLGIYVGFNSPFIIRYLEPLTSDVFKTRFADCHFDEAIFPPLGGEKEQQQHDITWNALELSHFDLRTNQCEREHDKPVGAKDIVPRKRKSHKKAGTPEEATRGATDIINQSEITAFDKVEALDESQVPKIDEIINIDEAKATDDSMAFDEAHALDEAKLPKNDEISLNYEMRWNRNKIVVDNIFSYVVTLDIDDKDPEPQNVEECRRRNDWPK
ncbi:uncharacterized protein LOC132301375 [Cornus florida]|uniref:uncharacterized protein LOC132301375 n=1 Tax=Cornus florida TaxID=4283 RepID=UPI0028A1A16F|nr:uncharacterized protein LOC132301375 [Cornus florida]